MVMVDAIQGGLREPFLPPRARDVPLEERIEERRRELRGDLGAAPVETAPEDRSVRFEPRPDLGLIQTRVIDRAEGEVVREVPPTARLDFAARFRRQLADAIGLRIDTRA